MRPSVAILCGGRGARLQEHTQSIPKPLVQVGGRPILWHVISIHISQGFSDFLLLTGYRGDRIASFAADSPWPADVRIRCVDTGENTPTGGRLHRAAELLERDRFCLEPSVLSLLSDRSVLEREPLSGLAGGGRLSAYRHDGFWHCMDTYKDAVVLNDLWDADPAAVPWLAAAPVG